MTPLQALRIIRTIVNAALSSLVEKQEQAAKQGTPLLPSEKRYMEILRLLRKILIQKDIHEN